MIHQTLFLQNTVFYNFVHINIKKKYSNNNILIFSISPYVYHSNISFFLNLKIHFFFNL